MIHNLFHSARLILPTLTVCLLASCAGKADNRNISDPAGTATVTDSGENPGNSRTLSFSGDSAYSYVAKQVEFGPRVPNSEAHRRTGEWLISELKRHGAEVVTQPMQLTTFDGVRINSINIMGRINPDAKDRVLLLAHWDCRPWADEDSDPAKRNKPVDGANDGASGVGVMLEIARCLNAKNGASDAVKGVDLLFVDAEDWGTAGDDTSWSLGTQAFVNNPPVPDYVPKEAILLDMVGGKDAVFAWEYISAQAAPQLYSTLWKIADRLGYAEIFPQTYGGMVTDDHVPLINAGIPAVDIIEYHPGTGFNPTWHTSEDNMSNIDPTTLEAVGRVVMTYLRSQKNN